MSIKLKVTLWYTLFMTVVVILVLWILIGLSSSRVLSTAQSQLKEVVLASFQELEWDKEEQRLDIDDDLAYFQSGVYLVMYDPMGYLLYGMVPKGFPEGIALSNETTEEVRAIEGQTTSGFYIFDANHNVAGYGPVWVRGVISKSETKNAFDMIVRMACILLPLMILCIAVGGYYITKRAFAPIRKITETAARISKGNDLSQRIYLGEGQDEVYLLANTFDHMLKKLEQQFEKEKRFTADVSHELRTPVSVIVSQCEYALEQEDEQNQSKEALQIIGNQARKMAKMIAQLLTLSRADVGKERLQIEVVNLSELIEMVILEQQENAQIKQITVETLFPADVIIKADETMMMRFFINLLQNAIVYGHQGGYVKISLTQENDCVKGSVEDNGQGIPLEEMEKIWDRFYQVDAARTGHKESGVGLGLPMVKWIANAHGGSVWLEHNAPRGCRFSFTFPTNQ